MNEPVRNPPKLKPCPLCGKPLTIYGPEDWKPTFYDPDSGGDPYNAVCDCGFSFSNGSYDYDKFAAGLNRRAERTGRWIEDASKDYGHICSECGSTPLNGYIWAICPNCHAHMIGGEEHA